MDSEARLPLRGSSAVSEAWTLLSALVALSPSLPSSMKKHIFKKFIDYIAKAPPTCQSRCHSRSLINYCRGSARGRGFFTIILTTTSSRRAAWWSGLLLNPRQDRFGNEGLPPTRLQVLHLYNTQIPCGLGRLSKTPISGSASHDVT